MSAIYDPVLGALRSGAAKVSALIGAGTAGKLSLAAETEADVRAAAGVVAASTTVAGIAELATSAETSTGTSEVLAVTPKGLFPAPVAIAAAEIDWAAGSVFTKTLDANTTFTFANAKDGQTIIVRLTNTASNYTVTWPACKWVGGSQSVQTVGAKSDVWTFVKIGDDIFGAVSQNHS